MRAVADQRAHHCVIAAYHGLWERPDNGFADMVVATAAKGNAPDFEMPAGTGNDTGEVSSSGHPTSRNATPATAPFRAPVDDERARQSPPLSGHGEALRQFAERASRKRSDCRWRTEKRRSNGPSVGRRGTDYEGLCKLLVASRPSLGIFSNEGGQFVGGGMAWLTMPSCALPQACQHCGTAPPSSECGWMEQRSCLTVGCRCI